MTQIVSFSNPIHPGQRIGIRIGVFFDFSAAALAGK